MGIIFKRNGKRYIMINGFTFPVDAEYCLRLMDDLLEEEPHLHREVLEKSPSKIAAFTPLHDVSDKHYL